MWPDVMCYNAVHLKHTEALNISLLTTAWTEFKQKLLNSEKRKKQSKCHLISLYLFAFCCSVCYWHDLITVTLIGNDSHIHIINAHKFTEQSIKLNLCILKKTYILTITVSASKKSGFDLCFRGMNRKDKLCSHPSWLTAFRYCHFDSNKPGVM